LDYANSLLFGTSSYNICQLQRVQNRLACVVIGNPALSDKQRLDQLHWLPVQHRIDFKIASLTNKIIATGQPSYLHSLINQYHPTRTLRSSSQEMLVIPPLSTNFGRRHSFGYASPKIWNSLPLCLRQSSSTAAFNSNLKTHFFTAS
jgi:hypothetical protein